MGREEELWDDSALINAFNDALSNHKMMHNQGGSSSLAEEGKILDITEEICSEKDGNGYTINRESGSPGRKNYNVVSAEPDKSISSLDGQNQDEQTGFLSSQTSEDYNQLLSKYYELEDQRQKVLQQLNQFGYWDYQNSIPAASNQNIGPATSISQEHQAYATEAPHLSVACSCCPYGYQTLVAPCSLLPACGLDAVCVDQTGKTTSSVEGKAKAAEVNPDHKEKSSCSDSDFHAVMNAWYSTGFYTGKNLAEQKRQG